MSLELHPLALPRQPRQKRAIDRFEAVLEAAGRLLEKHGHGGFSIPAVAEATGFNRASIYKFFPTPYAILNELTRRHFVGLEESLVRSATELGNGPWEDVVRELVKRAAAYHNAHPVGLMLALGGAVTDESYRSYAVTVQELGALSRQLLAGQGIVMPTAPLDAATLAVDLGTTCFRQSYFRHKRITPAYQDAAAAVMISFIRSHLPS